MQGLIKSLVDLIVEQQYQSKLGDKLNFTIKKETNFAGEQEGWVLYKITAYIESEPVGYIKISYIPEENFNKLYPNIIDYATKKASLNLNYDESKYNWEDFSFPEKVKHIVDYHNEYVYSKEHEIQLDNLSQRQKQKLLSDFVSRIENKYKEQYMKFKSFHMDKPLVDFIRVEEGYKRKRIAAALYEYVARWLAKQDKRLYASGIQTPAAQKTWEWIKNNKKAQIGTETDIDGKSRTYLSYL